MKKVRLSGHAMKRNTQRFRFTKQQLLYFATIAYFNGYSINNSKKRIQRYLAKHEKNNIYKCRIYKGKLWIYKEEETEIVLITLYLIPKGLREYINKRNNNKYK